MAYFPWSRKKKNKARLPNSAAEQQPDAEVSVRTEETAAYLDRILGASDDLVMRRFEVQGGVPALLCYFSHLSPNAVKDVLKPLMEIRRRPETGEKLEGEALKKMLMNDVLYTCDGSTEKRLAPAVEALLQGKSVVHVEGLNELFVFETLHLDKRSITQPETEQVIRGPREGFIERLTTNIAILRYRLRTTKLRVKMRKIGKLAHTEVAVCYIEGIANPALVEEVNRRLSQIDIDGIHDSGGLEQFIEDNHYSPFPQVQNTERPDKVVSNLLEGRVALLMDGSPFALIVPAVFSQFYQTAEDYAERFLLVSFIRLARLIALVFSLIFPSLYVAVISFNPELIPTEFAVAVAGGRAGVPFPAAVEVLIMEVSMEVLREATIRLPQQVGGALSIVGVLVVGQAAVAAGFASPITVVVIALTTIGSFATPAYNAALALRLLRFPLVMMAGMFGLYGVMVGLILIANHMLSLKSFGVPYLSPIVPGNFEGMKDTVIRSPLWWMKKRPAMLHTPDKTRVANAKSVTEPMNNTLDPLTAGNKKEGTGNGQSAANDRDSSGDRSY